MVVWKHGNLCFTGRKLKFFWTVMQSHYQNAKIEGTSVIWDQPLTTGFGSALCGFCNKAPAEDVQTKDRTVIHQTRSSWVRVTNTFIFVVLESCFFTVWDTILRVKLKNKLSAHLNVWQVPSEENADWQVKVRKLPRTVSTRRSKRQKGSEWINIKPEQDNFGSYFIFLCQDLSWAIHMFIISRPGLSAFKAVLSPSVGTQAFNTFSFRNISTTWCPIRLREELNWGEGNNLQKPQGCVLCNLPLEGARPGALTHL